MIKNCINSNGLLEIWDETIEENSWVILEQADHAWALYANAEHRISFDTLPYKIYPNYELGDAIKQGQKWT